MSYSQDIVGYVYDADVRCRSCAFKRFKVRSESALLRKFDSERNLVGVYTENDAEENLTDFNDQQDNHNDYSLTLDCGGCGQTMYESSYWIERRDEIRDEIEVENAPGYDWYQPKSNSKSSNVIDFRSIDPETIAPWNRIKLVAWARIGVAS